MILYIPPNIPTGFVLWLVGMLCRHISTLTYRTIDIFLYARPKSDISISVIQNEIIRSFNHLHYSKMHSKLVGGTQERHIIPNDTCIVLLSNLQYGASMWISIEFLFNCEFINGTRFPSCRDDFGQRQCMPPTVSKYIMHREFVDVDKMD